MEMSLAYVLPMRTVFLPSEASVESPEEPDNRLTAAVRCPFHSGTGNGNTDDVTQNVDRGSRAYNAIG